MLHITSDVYSLWSWKAVCLSLHGVVSGLQSVTKVSIVIPTAVSVICYASRLQDMELTRPWNTVWVNSPTSLPSLFPVHSTVLPFIPYQSNYRTRMIKLRCYWYVTLEQIPPSLEDVLTDHMVYVWWSSCTFNTNIQDVPDSYSCKPVGPSEGHSFLKSAGMQDRLLQQYGIYLEFLSIIGTFGIAGLCKAFKVMESICSNICIHFVNLKILLCSFINKCAPVVKCSLSHLIS